MISISYKQYLILKKLYKAKPNPVQLDASSDDFNFLHDNKLIQSQSIPLDKKSDIVIGFLAIPNGLSTITDEGQSVYNSYCIESRRHWQSIFIPQVLNVVVSAVTTLITFFILQFLSG